MKRELIDISHTIDKIADRADNAAQRPREQRVEMVNWSSLFVGPGFNLNI